jgi:uncharacterized protein (TIGR03435 family)
MKSVNGRRNVVAVVMAACGLLVMAALVHAQGAHRRARSVEDYAFAEVSMTKGAPDAPVVDLFHYGHWELTAVTLRDLIRMAYASDGISAENQVLGGPEWGATNRYVLHAIMEARDAARPDVSHLRSFMLRRVLAERFALSVRRGTDALATYDLVRLDGHRLGSRLVPSVCTERARLIGGLPARGLECPPVRFAAANIATDVSMPQLAAALSRVPDVGRVVRDRTGLAGAFHLQLIWSGGSFNGSAEDGVQQSRETLGGGSLIAALQAQLRLTLHDSFGRVNVIHVDHAEIPVLD